MKILSQILSLAFILFSCKADYNERATLSALDSAMNDLLKYNLLAYYEASDEIKIIDQVSPGSDTIRLDEFGIRLLKSNDSDEDFEVKKGNFLIVEDCDQLICKLKIYNGQKTYVGVGFLPLKATVRLTNPYLDRQILNFYSTQKKLKDRYMKMTQDKYNLTDRQLDSLLYTNLDKIKSEIKQ
jgi:hypothetical protein